MSCHIAMQDATASDLQGHEHEQNPETSGHCHQKIAGHDAVGLRVTHKNHQEVRLFFDKTSALPIKSEVKLVANFNDDIHKELLVEIFFSNYKEIAGVSHFTRVRIHFDDDDLEINLNEVELREKLDAAVFAKP